MSNNPRARKSSSSKAAAGSDSTHKRNPSAKRPSVSRESAKAKTAVSHEDDRKASRSEGARKAAQPKKRTASSAASASRSSSAGGDRVASKTAQRRTTSSGSGKTRPSSRNPRTAKAKSGRKETMVFDEEFIPAVSSSSVRPVSTKSGRMPVMPSKKKRGLSTGRKVAIVVVAVILVLGLCTGGVAFAAMGQATELKERAGVAMTDINEVMADIKNKDYDGAVNAAIDAKNAANDMDETLQDPLWGFLGALPVIGEDIANTKVAVDALQIATADALVPLTSALQATPLSDLIKADKSIDVDALNRLLNAVAAAAPAMQECTDMIEGLPDFHIAQIQNALGGAKEKIVPANELFQQVADMAPIFGTLLGAEGNRTYLIAAQNSAEPRAAGGFPGSVGLVHINDGVIEFDDFQKIYDVWPDLPTANPPISDVERELFDDGEDHLQRTNDIGVIPDFTRVASIWADSYTEHTGTEVDGVISVTPSVVQDVLALTGGITLSDGTYIDGTNATKVLEHDLYWKYMGTNSSAVQNSDLIDLLFAEAASEAIGGMFSTLGSGGLTDFAQVILDDASTREFMVWLTDEGEQEKLAALDVSGDLGGTIEDPELGVYVTSIVPSKAGWYIDVDTQVSDPVENADGTQTYDVTCTILNALTSAELASASTYIIGGYAGVSRGDVHPWMYFVAPTGGSISDVTDDAGASIRENEYNGVQVVRTESVLNPQQSVTYTFKVTTAAGAESELSVATTPLLTEYRVD